MKKNRVTHTLGVTDVFKRIKMREKNPRTKRPSSSLPPNPLKGALEPAHFHYRASAKSPLGDLGVLSCKV
jgi:hypothetical protein